MMVVDPERSITGPSIDRIEWVERLEIASRDGTSAMASRRMVKGLSGLSHATPVALWERSEPSDRIDAAEEWTVFSDRRDAGRRLARRLIEYAATSPVIIGLARGGVPVAAEVATALGTELDVVVVRKLGCPWHPELGIGAIAEGGIRIVNDELVHELGVSAEELSGVTQRELAELDRRVRLYRGGRPPAILDGRVVIVVDDGLATGYTALAAIEAVRRRGAGAVIVAVPVASTAGVRDIRPYADEIVTVLTVDDLVAIALYYTDFGQTSDDEVRALVQAAARRARTDALVTAGDQPASSRAPGRESGQRRRDVMDARVPARGPEAARARCPAPTPRSLASHGSRRRAVPP
jgi:putative phosphoribosyl transferase